MYLMVTFATRLDKIFVYIFKISFFLWNLITLIQYDFYSMKANALRRSFFGVEFIVQIWYIEKMSFYISALPRIFATAKYYKIIAIFFSVFFFFLSKRI